MPDEGTETQKSGFVEIDKVVVGGIGVSARLTPTGKKIAQISRRVNKVWINLPIFQGDAESLGEVADAISALKSKFFDAEDSKQFFKQPVRKK